MRYLRLTYHIEYERAVFWRYPPETIFRSVLGMHLRRICCVLKDQQSCAACPLHGTCVYAWFFESYIEKTVPGLEGRDRAPHPFVLDYDQTDSLHATVTVTFLGRSRNFIPYISMALEKAGSQGVSRDRTRYTITAITNQGKPYTFVFSQIEQDSSQWSCTAPVQEADVLVTFQTPCRIKEAGKYLTTINARQLLNSCARRISTLETLYGDAEQRINVPEQIPEAEPFAQHWKDRMYYSVRQQSALKLGGVEGSLLFKAPIPQDVMALLIGGALFHVGKNVSFGLGRIQLEEGTKHA